MLFIGSVTSQSISKTTSVFSKMYNYVDVKKTYENDSLIEINMVWFARNAKYQSIVDLLTVFRGDPSDMLQLIDYMIQFNAEQDVDVSTTVHDLYLSNSKTMGMKYLYIGIGSGYISLMPKTLKGIQTAVTNWINSDKDYQLELE